MKEAHRSAPKSPNPQGKGVVPVLRDWGTLQPRALRVKSPVEFLRDYCVSSLVLAATFRFKPVVGNTYYLYADKDEWSLSLIAPHEWGERKAGKFLARCRLRSDMTWAMDTTGLSQTSEALARARQFVQGFVDSLAAQDSISANLPLYVARLPYYQRMLATALASSLQQSLPATGDSMQALLGNLPEHTALLEHPGCRENPGCSARD